MFAFYHVFICQCFLQSFKKIGINSECQETKFNIFTHTTCKTDIWDDNHILACKLGNKTILLCYILTPLLDMAMLITEYNERMSRALLTSIGLTSFCKTYSVKMFALMVGLRPKPNKLLCVYNSWVQSFAFDQ